MSVYNHVCNQYIYNQFVFKSLRTLIGCWVVRAFSRLGFSRFSYRPSDEGGVKSVRKNRREIRFRRDRAIYNNNDFYCIAFGSFSSLFLVLCSSSDVAVYLCLWTCLFPPVKHSFASLIDKQLSIKATLMFQDVLLFELFQRTYLILNQLRILSRQNVPDRKNMHCPLTAPRGQYAFSAPLVQQPVSLRHELKTNSAI